MTNLRMLFRWSRRDLRSRWIQVGTIALIIAIGTGLYAGLTSTTPWREMSNDASFAATNMHDYRVQLSAGNFVPRGALVEALADAGLNGTVREAEERLIVPTQVSVETEGGEVIVPGRIVGADLAAGGPHINTLFADRGRPLADADAGDGVAMLERNFAKFYGLPPEGALKLAGDRGLSYVGHALSPEYFLVVTEEGGLLAQEHFAAVFTSLETAQSLAGAPGAVNDLLLTLDDAADHRSVSSQLEGLFIAMGGSVLGRDDDPSYRILTGDVEGDQQFYNILAIAIFAGAVFAAFNLIGRVVEAQRHEIGIAMALGVPAPIIALRPMLFGAQIAFLGVVFGIGVGVGLGRLMRGFLISFTPLPVWETPFQPGLFAGVAAIGFLVPFAAIAYPVWRAVRVAPVDAIKRGAARSGGLPALLKRLPLPGRSLVQMPFRNLARAPRRTVLTVLGVSAIIAILVMIMGMVDSFLDTLDRSEREVVGDHPDRVAIELDAIYPVGAPAVEAVMQSSVLSGAEPGLRLGGLLSKDGEEVEVFLLFTDFDSTLWRPTIVNGEFDPQRSGLVIAEKAAKDLGVSPGDTVTLRYPRVTGPGTFSLEESQLPVAGTHPNPYRFNAFMDLSQAGLTGLAGATNVIYGVPAVGVEADEVTRQMFQLTGVGSVRRVAASAEALSDLVEQFLWFLRVMQGAVLLLALLIAYNASSINMDERSREHATMMAFGVPLRKVLGMAATESFFLGVASTLIGLVGGYLLLKWLLVTTLPDTMPEVGMDIVVSPVTLATAVVLGVMAVAVAPLLSYRKLRRMDLTSALRVME